MDVAPGAQLGQYRIVEQVGRGGMATVYKAFQAALDRYVAVKVLPGFYAEEPSFLERFRQEARTVSQLRHPNILSVFDFGEQDGVTYMVSEFLPGGTLEQLLGEPLPLARTVELLGPIAAALDYAHGRGMIHRDVKPSNILLTAEGEPVLTDFGVARIVAGTSRLTATGTAVGTPEYMAPEQAAGDPTTAASDRYALGIVLYEMLTGRTPFQAETPVAVALAHMHKPLPLPRSLNANLPEAAETLLLKALAKEPVERFDSARAMVEALEHAIRSSQTAAQEQAAPGGPEQMLAATVSPTPPPIVKQSDVPRVGADHSAPVPPRPASSPPTLPMAAPTGRRSIVPIVAGLIGLLLIVGTGGFFLFSRQSRQPTSEKPVAAAGKAQISLTTEPTAQAAAAAPPAGAPVSSAASPKVGLAKPERLALDRLFPQLINRFGPVVERDDFSNPANALFNISANIPNGRIAYEGGSLVMEYSRTAMNEQPGVTSIASRPASFTNGLIDVEARLLAGPDTTNIGIQVRRTPNTTNGYFVLISPRRKLTFLQKEANSERSELGRAQTDGILPDGVNRITVLADGADLQVYVNAQQVIAARDETFTAGQVALSLGLGAANALGDVRATFDDFRVVSLK